MWRLSRELRGLFGSIASQERSDDVQSSVRPPAPPVTAPPSVYSLPRNASLHADGPSAMSAPSSPLSATKTRPMAASSPTRSSPRFAGNPKAGLGESGKPKAKLRTPHEILTARYGRSNECCQCLPSFRHLFMTISCLS
jgi:hypothetical protein